jgi:hypothetical protein
MNNYCQECAETTGGRCSKHLIQTIWYPVITEMINISACTRCALCGQSENIVVQMPYGSRHDGDYICAKCISDLLDPVLDRARCDK